MRLTLIALGMLFLILGQDLEIRELRHEISNLADTMESQAKFDISTASAIGKMEDAVNSLAQTASLNAKSIDNLTTAFDSQYHINNLFRKHEDIIFKNMSIEQFADPNMPKCSVDNLGNMLCAHPNGQIDQQYPDIPAVQMMPPNSGAKP